MKKLTTFIIAFILSSIIEKSDCEKSCAPKHVKRHEKFKYKRDENENDNFYKWDQYIQKINAATEKYRKCTSTNCSCYFGQIEKDLRPWKDGISESLFQKATTLTQVSHYQIIDHKLYRNEEAVFPLRNRGIEHFLIRIVKKLPDMEFILNTFDLPKISKKMETPIPVFSFSKIESEYYDILYPNWAFWEGGPVIKDLYPYGLGRWDEKLKVIQAEAKKWHWDKKTEKVFFRGSRTSEERDALILLTQQKPQLFDARYTKNLVWKSIKGPFNFEPAAEVKLEDHCKYKYLINFPGVSASFRFRHLFLCDSLVYHVGSDWIEFFYDQLKPWIHYVPIDKSLNNIEELVEFATENDEVARNIAKRGKKEIIDHLKMEDIYCYWENLLKSYASLLKYKIKRNESLIEVNSKKY